MQVLFDSEFLCAIEKDLNAKDVGLEEEAGIFDGPVHVTLGDKVHDVIQFLLGKDPLHCLKVRDDCTVKLVGGIRYQVGEVGQVSGIGDLVYINDVIYGFSEEEADKIAPDEP